MIFYTVVLACSRRGTEVVSGRPSIVSTRKGVRHGYGLTYMGHDASPMAVSLTFREGTLVNSNNLDLRHGAPRSSKAVESDVEEMTFARRTPDQ
ncbi:hypothetical protein BD311DRAFT_744841 [Dichomitus squalens]|uniref:Uncharacterized protein n=1 Tax=Dichomitus squalens TaxID=114155 RepID=A0A4Q9NA52_9APHY|nr:hypothetical protein BD311DRAFT_744841 [Dichomitus squalens]